ncbi:MAG: hypothetical protein ABJB05_06795 [Parafilimonas sp.]
MGNFLAPIHHCKLYCRNNTVKIKFYNNDFSQRFRVIVEGITTDGKLTHIEKMVE